MLTEREKEIVASFKPWAKAFGRDDLTAMNAAEATWWNSERTVSEIRRDAKVSVRLAGMELKEARDAEIERQYRAGHMVKSIAAAAGLSLPRVFSILAMRGVPRRR